MSSITPSTSTTSSPPQRIQRFRLRARDHTYLPNLTPVSYPSAPQDEHVINEPVQDVCQDADARTTSTQGDTKSCGMELAVLRLPRGNVVVPGSIIPLRLSHVNWVKYFAERVNENDGDIEAREPIHIGLLPAELDRTRSIQDDGMIGAIGTLAVVTSISILDTDTNEEGEGQSSGSEYKTVATTVQATQRFRIASPPLFTPPSTINEEASETSDRIYRHTAHHVNRRFVRTVNRGTMTEKFVVRVELLDEKDLVVGGHSMMYPPHYLSKWNATARNLRDSRTRRIEAKEEEQTLKRKLPRELKSLNSSNNNKAMSCFIRGNGTSTLPSVMASVSSMPYSAIQYCLSPVHILERIQRESSSIRNTPATNCAANDTDDADKSIHQLLLDRSCPSSIYHPLVQHAHKIISTHLPSVLSTKEQLHLLQNLDHTNAIELLHFIKRRLVDVKNRDEEIGCVNCHTIIASMGELVEVPGADGTCGAYVNEHGYIHQTLTVQAVIPGKVLIYGNAETKDSWFPGYSWTIACCGFCHAHLGWKFLPVVDAVSDNDDSDDNNDNNSTNGPVNTNNHSTRDQANDENTPSICDTIGTNENGGGENLRLVEDSRPTSEALPATSARNPTTTLPRILPHFWGLSGSSVAVVPSSFESSSFGEDSEYDSDP